MEIRQGIDCNRCGQAASFGFGHVWLCIDCYGVIGSCCMEFDGDDLYLEERSWEETRLATKP
jgi:hypothetical protein